MTGMIHTPAKQQAGEPLKQVEQKCTGFSLDDPLSFLSFDSLFQDIDAELDQKRFAVMAGHNQLKTTCVRSYIQSRLGSYEHVAWIDVSLLTGLQAGASKVAKRFGIHSRRTLLNLIQSVEDVLKHQKKWLLVLDHYDQRLHADRIQHLVDHNPGGKFIFLVEKSGVFKKFFSFNHVEESHTYVLYQHIFGRQLVERGEKEAVNALHEAVHGDPVALRLAFSYAKHTDQGVAEFWEYVQRKVSESNPDAYFKFFFSLCIGETGLKKAIVEKGASEQKSAYHFLNCWVHGHTENLPLTFVESFFKSEADPKEYALKVLFVLADYGLIAPLATAGTDAKQLTFSLDQKIQEALINTQTQEGMERDYFALGTEIAEMLFGLDRRNLANLPSSDTFNHLAMHLENMLSHASRVKSKGRNSGIISKVLARGFNSLGLFFSRKEAFETALLCYDYAEHHLKDLENQEQREVDLGEYSIKAEVLHNKGSAYLRLWEGLSMGARIDAVEALERSSLEFQLEVEAWFSEELSKEDRYNRKHFAVYSLRALARAHKKLKQYSQAREILERIHRIREYVRWPEGSSISRTFPLSLMDLGVVYRLIARSQLAYNRKNLRGLGLESSQERRRYQRSQLAEQLNLVFPRWGEARAAKSNVTFNDALDKLKSSVRWYESSNYQQRFPEYEKDLGIALIRLGECYLDMTMGNFLSKRSARFVIPALHSFLKAKAMLRKAFEGEASINEGRAAYRLAFIYYNAGILDLAFREIQRAIEIQKMFLQPHHPYLTASLVLEEKIGRTMNAEKEIEAPPVLEVFSAGTTVPANPVVAKIDQAHTAFTQKFTGSLQGIEFGQEYLDTLDDFEAKILKPIEGMRSSELSQEVCDAVYQALRSLKAIGEKYQYVTHEETAKLYQRRKKQVSAGAFFISQMEVCFGQKLAFHINRLEAHKFYQVVYNAYLKHIQESKLAFGGILSALSKSMRTKGRKGKELNIDEGLAELVFNSLDQVVIQIANSFSEQIKKLDVSSRSKFARHCVMRILNFMTQKEGITVAHIKEQLWLGVFRGTGKDENLRLLGGTEVMVSDLIQKCGVRNIQGDRYTLKKGDMSTKVGFRLEEDEEFDLRDEYTKIDSHLIDD